MSFQNIRIRCSRTDRLRRVKGRKQRLNLRIEGIQYVDGIQAGGQPRTLVSYIGDTQENVLRKLPFDGQVPLLRVRPPVGVQGPIEDAMTIVKRSRDKRGKLCRCRDSIV